MLADGTVLAGHNGHQELDQHEFFFEAIKKSGVTLENHMSGGIAKALSEMIGALHIFTTDINCNVLIYGDNKPTERQLQGIAKLYEAIPEESRKPLTLRYQKNIKPQKASKAEDLEGLSKREVLRAKLRELNGGEDVQADAPKTKVTIAGAKVTLKSLREACAEMSINVGVQR